MRLLKSRVAAEEELTLMINEGYQVLRNIQTDYDAKSAAGQFDAARDNAEYLRLVNEWLNRAARAVQSVFPTPLEFNVFVTQPSFAALEFPGVDRTWARLIRQTLPAYLDRLQKTLTDHLPRYTDLPIADRLFVEDIDSFRRVRDVNPAAVADLLHDGRLDLDEDAVQLALEAILDVSFHRRDWGGEINDLYTSNVIVNGARVPTAFLLKGRGLRDRELQLSGCGRNGDQIVRLFDSPARLFVVQFIGPIADNVIRDVQGKVAEKRARGEDLHFLIIDGQDTARLLRAYGRL